MAAPVSAFRRNAAGPMGVKLRLLLWEEQSRGRTCLEPAEMMGTLTPVPPEPGLQLMAAPPPPRTPAAPPRNTGQDLHHHRPKVFTAGWRSHTAASGISHMLSSMRFRAFDRLKYFGALQVSLVKALLLCLQLRRLVDAPCWSCKKSPQRQSLIQSELQLKIQRCHKPRHQSRTCFEQSLIQCLSGKTSKEEAESV